MARPTKWRKIENIPTVQNFIPSASKNNDMQGNVLLLEELEAIRLKDLEGLEQEECATRMEVSRPTFQRILTVGRQKVADSLIYGKSIFIDGGNYTRNICPIKCLDCGKERLESFENMESVRSGSYVCTECGSVNVTCNNIENSGFCHRNCRRRGRNMGQRRMGNK